MQQNAVLLALACLPFLACAKKEFMCGDYACPRFKVIGGTEDYAVRCYAKTTWAAVSSTGPASDGASALYWYLQGANADHKQMNMTAPVVRAVGPAATTTLFYLNVTKNPPQPTNADVYFWNLPSRVFYVRAFNSSGSPAEDMYQTELRALKKAIGSGQLYNQTVHYRATYLSSKDVGNWTNEVWLTRL